ncbi:MAG: hypothetical protein FWG98_10140 [Candidatus Cloacimonetes bacterium]|nr:hypothetical protein [Candidatus Cloacimonadota bacterium]
MNKNPLIIVIGAYGSGKSEYSINLAKKMKKAGKDKVSLADLDVVNPYFRSRDAQELLEKEGIDVIAPESSYGTADLPMISPRVRGAINDLNKTVILDVGGDPTGCKTLGRFEEEIKNREYEMILVVNTKRPFTSSAQEIFEMKSMLEKISRLKISEIVCNANLMEFTDIKLIEEGIAIVQEVAKKENLIFRTYLVMNDIENKYHEQFEGVKKMNLEYFLNKPWE